MPSGVIEKQAEIVVGQAGHDIRVTHGARQNIGDPSPMR